MSTPETVVAHLDTARSESTKVSESISNDSTGVASTQQWIESSLTAADETLVQLQALNLQDKIQQAMAGREQIEQAHIGLSTVNALLTEAKGHIAQINTNLVDASGHYMQMQSL